MIHEELHFVMDCNIPLVFGALYQNNFCHFLLQIQNYHKPQGLAGLHSVI